jgi:hypothetical protein
MSDAQHPGDTYATIMGELVEWLAKVYQERLSQAKEELVSAETVLGGLGYEERTEQMIQDGTEHPTPQRSLARLASWFAEIERELEDHRRLILKQQWESMAGEYALVSVQNLTEARQYLGLAQSALANLLVSLATNRLNAWEKQTKLYGVRLYLERLETAIIWAIESASNGLRQYQQDGGARRPVPPPTPPPPRVSTGAVSYQPDAPAAPIPPPLPAGTPTLQVPHPLTPAGGDVGATDTHPTPAGETPALQAAPPSQPTEPTGAEEPRTPASQNRSGFFKKLRRSKRPPKA